MARGREREFCRVEGCANGCHGSGLCHKHYEYQRRHGTPTPARPSRWRWIELVDQLSKICPRDGDCWIWPYSTDKNGYGKIRVEGKGHRANRAVLIATTGTVGQLALHSCDRPSCVNPGHLRWGTFSDNAKDMWIRGRASKNLKSLPGSLNGMSKLSSQDIREMRDMRASGVSCAELAAMYEVALGTVRRWVYEGKDGRVPDPPEA